MLKCLCFFLLAFFYDLLSYEHCMNSNCSHHNKNELDCSLLQKLFLFLHYPAGYFFLFIFFTKTRDNRERSKFGLSSVAPFFSTDGVFPAIDVNIFSNHTRDRHILLRRSLHLPRFNGGKYSTQGYTCLINIIVT